MSETPRFDPIEEAGRQWRRHWGPTHVGEMMAVTSVMRVQQILLARLNEVLEPFGLTFARYEALMLLYYSRSGALPLGRIGGRLQVHPTSVTNLIDGLERAGQVVRSPHPTDRRATLASITELGRQTALEATDSLHAIRFGTEPLSKTDLRALSDLLSEFRLSADQSKKL
ncbi:MAG TPA: MarR family transcriptional regulator [Solirubrobacteraceae bacterium]|nr:MarR family transcriptional regulator [Solirubrobacteraceae bacterium]